MERGKKNDEFYFRPDGLEAPMRHFQAEGIPLAIYYQYFKEQKQKEHARQLEKIFTLPSYMKCGT